MNIKPGTLAVIVIAIIALGLFCSGKAVKDQERPRPDTTQGVNR
jgi:hypothetical protein